MAMLTRGEYTNFEINSLAMYKALSHPCKDCLFLWHPFIMTFDHRERSTKKYTISSARILPPAVFAVEMAKCDVVCTNCHKIREYLRDKETMPIKDAKRARFNYYGKLVPYLLRGALLNRKSLTEVPFPKRIFK